MKNYKITVQYDGTRYSGWQRQGNTQNTIQDRFENVLYKMCGSFVEIYASGRTDAGVHAKRQIANFKCDTALSLTEIKNYLNRYLPDDILVTEIEEAEERFHSRLNAKSKTYEYKIALNKPDVFIRKYVFLSEGSVDVSTMKMAAEKLLGKHDFKGFSSVGKTKKSTERTIYSIDINEQDEILSICICGSGFLYNMVRIISGTLFAIGRGEMNPEKIDEILQSKNREIAGPTLPACGLMLVDVFYN